MQGTIWKFGDETQEALSEPKEKKQEALVDCEQQQQQNGDKDGPTLRLAKSYGPIPPALRKLAKTFSSRTRSKVVHTDVDGKPLHSFLPTIDKVSKEEDGDDGLARNIGEAVAMKAALDLLELAAGNMTPEPKNRR